MRRQNKRSVVVLSTNQRACLLCETVGTRCDECKAEFFNMSSVNDAGCESCNCDPFKSISTRCDAVTGQCECKSAVVVGRRCELCQQGWYIDDQLQQCSQCACHPLGTMSSDISHCNVTTAQCVCKPYVTGLTCDTCKHGYYE